MGMGVHHYLRVLVQVWLLSPVEGGGESMCARRCLKMLVQVWALVAVWSSGGHLCSSPLLHGGGGHGCLLLFMCRHCQLLTLCGSGCHCHRLLPIWVLVVIVVWWWVAVVVFA